MQPTGWQKTLAVVLFLLCSSVVTAEIDLEIEGVDGPVANNIRLHLAAWEELPGDNVNAIAEAFDTDVKKALQALGYYQAEISYRLEGNTVTVVVAPGEPVTWGNIDIQVKQGDQPATDFKSIIEQHEFMSGRAINHQYYDSFKRRLLNAANDLGYLDARLTQTQLQINPSLHIANVVIYMEAGERYRLGKVVINNSIINADLIAIIVDAEEGAWFNANSVGDIYNQLLNSGYFTSIDIDIEKKPPATANLLVKVVDAPEHRVSTGIGYGTDTGPRFKLKWHRPHTNPRGNSLNSQLELSEIQQSLTSRYRIPWQHPQNRYVSWDSGFRRKEVEDTLTQVTTTGLVFHLLRDGGWQYSAGVNLENEVNRVDDDPKTSTTYVIPSIHGSRRKFIGDANNPRFGYKYWLNIANSTDFLGSDTNFLRVNTGFNTVVSLGDSHSVVTRLELGAISADDFDLVPLSQRFFSGGDQTVRGYKFDTISPLDEDGDLIGGQYLVTGSVEYRYQWAPNWKAAIFADSGRSYLRDDAFCNNCIDTGREYRASAGFGVRWLSPVGFIALDIAFPLNAVATEEEPEGPRLHFYLGSPL